MSAEHKMSTLPKDEIKKEDQAANELEFSQILQRYRTTIKITSGCGRRGQSYIDNEYDNLKAFIKKHPEFTTRVPFKHQCDDDNTGGTSSGMASFIQNQF